MCGMEYSDCLAIVRTFVDACLLCMERLWRLVAIECFLVVLFYWWFDLWPQEVYNMNVVYSVLIDGVGLTLWPLTPRGLQYERCIHIDGMVLTVWRECSNLGCEDWKVSPYPPRPLRPSLRRALQQGRLSHCLQQLRWTLVSGIWGYLMISQCWLLPLTLYTHKYHLLSLCAHTPTCTHVHPRVHNNIK